MAARFWRVSWSLTEIAALASKAARGAGAPPKQAAQFGQAAARYLAEEHKSDVLVDALTALPNGPIMTLPVIIDAALVQLEDGGPIEIDAPFTPLLQCYVSCLPFETTLKKQGDKCLLCIEKSPSSPPSRPQRIHGSGGLIAHLEKLAAQTYVPDTEQSRSSGAGAGMTDND